MKNKKILIITVVCILLIAATVGGLYLFKKKPVVAADPNGTKPAGGSTGTTGAANDAFPLKMGSKGANVKALQTRMNEWMDINWPNLINIKPRHQSGLLKGTIMSSISVDGDFGANTLEFCGFVFGSTQVTEAQFNIMQSTTSTGTTSGWDDSSVPDKAADESYWDYWVENIGKFF